MNSRFTAALLTISASVALPLLSLAPASAVTVTVDNIDYDVDVYMGAYSGNPSLFQTPPSGKMPWSGDGTGDLAAKFAEQVYKSLVVKGPTAGYGPVFAYELSVNEILGYSQSLTDPLSQNPEVIATDVAINYAIATPLRPAPSSVPAPLPVFGAAAAFGWSRQLRKRIADIHGWKAKK
jgi:hypothetical protein